MWREPHWSARLCRLAVWEGTTVLNVPSSDCLLECERILENTVNCPNFTIRDVMKCPSPDPGPRSLALGDCGTTNACYSNCSAFSSALSTQQRQLCRSDIPVSDSGQFKLKVCSICQGICEAIIDCQLRFNNSKWICSTFEGPDPYGAFINDGENSIALFPHACCWFMCSGSWVMGERCLGHKDPISTLACVEITLIRVTRQDLPGML